MSWRGRVAFYLLAPILILVVVDTAVSDQYSSSSAEMTIRLTIHPSVKAEVDGRRVCLVQDQMDYELGVVGSSLTDIAHEPDGWCEMGRVVEVGDNAVNVVMEVVAQ